MSLRMKKNFLFAPLVLSMVFFAGLARGDSMLMIGGGGATCSVFLEESGANKMWEFLYHSWAEGYMSAINVRNTATNSDINLFVATLQGRQQIDFLKNDCKDNPDQTFVFAVMNLYNELKRRQ